MLNKDTHVSRSTQVLPPGGKRLKPLLLPKYTFHIWKICKVR